MIKRIYVFDMGKVITKPAKLGNMYLEADAKCRYEDFKNMFYYSKKTDEVYKGLITDDEYFDYIRTESGSSKTLGELKNLYLENKGGIYTDTMDAIKELKEEGNNVCLLSNLKDIDYQYLSQNIDMSLFDEQFLSYKLGMMKPDSEIYEYVIKKLGTNDFYFFDDTIKNIVSARILGIKGVNATGENIAKCLKMIR